MANYDVLKAAIASAIKQNNNNEITGNLLQQYLLAMIGSLGAGYQFMGVASPQTDPGTPDQNVFYIAVQAGEFVNFNGINITRLSILSYNGQWRAQSLDIPFSEEMFMFHRTLSVDEDVFVDTLPIGVYATVPQESGLPENFGNGYGWLIVFQSNLRIVFNNDGDFWFKTSESGWNYQTKVLTDLAGDSQTRPVSQSAIKGAVADLNGGISAISDSVDDVIKIINPSGGVEILPDETLVGYILTVSTGLPYALPSVPQYELKKYNVSPGGIIRIVANANYQNYLYSFIDGNGNLLTGNQSEAGAAYTKTDETIVVPRKAVTLYVAYNTDTEIGRVYGNLANPAASNFLLGKKWACVGDSLTEVNARTTKHYFDYIAEETGVIPLNYGVSGTGYARRRDENIAFYQRISQIDVSSDIVTIFGSFNDLGAITQDFPLGDIDDSGIVSVAGCINQTLDNLFAVKPIVRLGIVAPTPWDGTQPGTWATSDNYVALLKEICEHRSIPFLDLYHHSNLRPWDATFRQLAYSKDGGSGTHPDETGHSLIAPMFRQFILTLI